VQKQRTDSKTLRTLVDNLQRCVRCHFHNNRSCCDRTIYAFVNDTFMMKYNR